MKQLFTILMCLQLILLPIPAAYAKSEGGSVANQLLSLGTTIVGSNLLTTCKFGSATPSILTAFSGSLVYIASEILGAKAQQSFIKVQKDEVKQMKAMLQAGGDLQLKILETKLKDEEKKLSFVKQRKNWTTAVAAIYTAAVVLAVMEGVCFYNPFTTATCVNWGMAACEPGSSLGTSELTTWLVVGAYGFGASSAGGGPISSYGSLLYTGISMMVKSTSTTVGSFYNEPIGRAITLGVAAALSMMVINDLNKIEGDLDSNVKEIKTLIADFKDKTEDPNGINSDKEAIDLANENLNLMQGSGNVNRMAIGEDLNRHCWGKDESGRQTYSEGACSTPIKISKPRYNPNFNLPTLQSIANTGHDMAQAVANGDTAAADIAAASLAANAMRLRQIKDNVLKQFNEQNKKQGKKELDFDKAVQDRIASMEKSLSDGLLSRGVDLANYSPSTPSKETKPVDDTKQEIKTAGSEEAVAVESSPQGFNIVLDEGLDEDLTSNTQGEMASTHSLEDFETQESDILAKPEVSIFKQLSNRYFLNYNRIFEKKSE